MASKSSSSGRDVETILVPVGGGGLLAGICVAVAAMHPEVKVVAVEPEGAAKLTAAMQAGGPSTLERATSMADGLLTLSVGAHDLSAHRAP